MLFEMTHEQNKAIIYRDQYPHPPNMIYDSAFDFYFMGDFQKYGKECDDSFFHQFHDECFQHGAEHVFFISKNNHNLVIQTLDERSNHMLYPYVSFGVAILNQQSIYYDLLLTPEQILKQLKKELQLWTSFLNNEVYQVIFYQENEPIDGVTVFGKNKAIDAIRSFDPYLINDYHNRYEPDHNYHEEAV